MLITDTFTVPGAALIYIICLYLHKAELDEPCSADNPLQMLYFSLNTSCLGAQLINAALDISALFDVRKDAVSRATRFTSKAPPRKILERVEEAAMKLGGSVKRRPESSRCASLMRCCKLQ